MLSNNEDGGLGPNDDSDLPGKSPVVAKKESASGSGRRAHLQAVPKADVMTESADNVAMTVTPVIRSERNVLVSARSRSSAEVAPRDNNLGDGGTRSSCCSRPTPGTVPYQAYLTFLTLGVIYGDIGTSPLYTFSTMFPVPPVGDDAVLGALSLMLWSLWFVVGIKYVVFILCADDHGEGGTFALFALLLRGLRSKIKDPETYKRVYWGVTMISLIGVAAVLADGILTPAITVMGAVQGLTVASENVTPAVVVGVSCAVIFLFFLPQRFGTSKIAVVFAPVIFLWFVSLAGIGIYNITRYPKVLQAFNPAYAVNFLGLDNTLHGYGGWQSLGAAFLTITGSEALFADLGHFNVRAIRTSALCLVLPCLTLCYCGQAAAIILDPAIVKNVFYLSIPAPLFYPMLVIAFCAAVIASQAMVSATFSILAQAIRLQYFPRMTVVHTDKTEFGQVYIPEINYFLQGMVIIVIIGFRDATALGYAYGVTVSLALLLTTILYSLVIWANFHRHWIWGVAFFCVFGFVDGNFLAANLLKFTTGGWFSVTLCLCTTLILVVWRMGRSRVLEAQLSMNRPMDELYTSRMLDSDSDAEQQSRHIIDVDTNLFICFSSKMESIPAAFVHFTKRLPVRPRHLVFVTVAAVNVAFVRQEMELVPIVGHNSVHRLLIKHGYAERPPSANKIASFIIAELQCYPDSARTFPPPSGDELVALANPTFIVGRDRVTLRQKSGMFHRAWVEIFQVLAFFSRSPIASFDLPPESTLEVGLQIQL